MWHWSQEVPKFFQFRVENQGIYMIVSREWKYFYSAGEDKEYLFDRLNDPQEADNKAEDSASQLVKKELKQALLEYLQSVNAEDTVDSSGGELDWQKYPKLDESYLEDPDASLLFQDHDAFVLERSGYTD